ncbi:fimbrial protein [Bordetella genomosp. 4]|uniref:Pilus assembly protein n=1 Tax=Bordetella genomosp. 4 TaxID=463044 RepID=A0A261V183_9BORD|nr:fimbrial protein [Bordetella genomosp. 4]OZI41758.1 pilus assembly protein [Bordetella genomosp. 4]OZI67685.1 pilus assembly protein [Bordetella genomosp. 4]
MASIFKRATLGLALAAALPMAAHAASGTVQFQGEIIQSTCDVTTATKDQTVVIGTYPTTLFKAVGDVSSSKAFTIDLENCEAGDYTVRFDGNTPAGQPELLAVSVATGVGIEILDNNDNVFPINQTLANPAYVTVGSDGTATVNLKARYKSFANAVTAGEANASSTFSIEYR